MRFDALIPMLQTADIRGTRAWYESVLGFHCEATDGQTWCRLSKDRIALMFMTNDHLGPAHSTSVQYIYTQDVLGLWDSLKERCVAEWGPEIMPYGLHEFAIKDPNGYYLAFGEPSATT